MDCLNWNRMDTETLMKIKLCGKPKENIEVDLFMIYLQQIHPEQCSLCTKNLAEAGRKSC